MSRREARELVVRLRISRPAAQILLGILLLGTPYGTLIPAGPVVVPYDLSMTATMPQPIGAFATLSSRGKTLLATIQSSSGQQNNVLIGQGQPCGRVDPGNYIPNPGTGIGLRGFILHNSLSSGCPNNALDKNIHQVQILSSPNFTMFPDPTQGASERAKVVLAGSIRASRLIWGRPGDPGALNVREWPFEIGNLDVTLCINPTTDPNTGNITCSVAYNRDPTQDHVRMTWTVYNSTGFGGNDLPPSRGGSGLYFPGVAGYFKTWLCRPSCGNLPARPLPAFWAQIGVNGAQPPEQEPGPDGQLHDNSLTPDAAPASIPYQSWTDFSGGNVSIRCRYLKETGPFPVHLDGECLLRFPAGVTGSFPYELKVSQCCRPTNPGCGLGC